MARCPALRVVATSRGPLRIGAEVGLPLPPLELPPRDATRPEQLRGFPSVALLVRRAEKAKPGFALNEANAPADAKICRRLDGLPLAPELAAARVRILDPAALLRRLSVFHEGWTLEAMEAVACAEDERFQALAELDSLVEKGLLRVAVGAERHSLLETIRAFAAEQLHASGEVETVRQAHAACFLSVAAGFAAAFRGPGQVEAVRRLHAGVANAHVALQEAIARSAEGGEDLMHALSTTLEGMRLFASGDLPAGRALVEKARRTQERIGDREGGGLSLSFPAQLSFAEGKPAGAPVLYEEALASFQELGDEPESARVLCEIGWTALFAGDGGRARRAVPATIAPDGRRGGPERPPRRRLQ